MLDCGLKEIFDVLCFFLYIYLYLLSDYVGGVEKFYSSQSLRAASETFAFQWNGSFYSLCLVW